MRLDVDPAARPALFRAFILSICFGIGAAVILAVINVSVPVIGLYPNGTLAFQILTVFYLTVGGLLAMLIYQIWGGASCLADLAIWLTALLALIGSMVIQRMLCAVLISTQSAARASRMSLACDPAYQRSVTYGSALAIVIITFAVWVAIRYLGRQVRKSG